MKKKISLIVLLSAITLSMSSFGAKAVRTDTVPVIDGKLTEECWEKAIPINDFRVINSEEKAQYKTTARILYNLDGLYFGVKCLRKDMKTILTEKRERDGTVYRDESIEIMLDTNQDQQTYYHFVVNASGSIFDRVCDQGGFAGNSKWDGAVKAATYCGSDFWSCEIFIPFYTLQITPEVGATWRLNIGRSAKNPEELSAISTDGTFNIAGSFATLTDLNADFSKYCWVLEKPTSDTMVRAGKLDLKLNSRITNNTGGKKLLSVECMLISPSEQVYVSSTNTDIQKNSHLQVTLGSFSLEEKGKYKYLISLNDPVTKVPLFRETGYLDIDYAPMAIDLLIPWYKNAIFATQGIRDIVFDVNLNMSQLELDKLSLEIMIFHKDCNAIIKNKKISLPLTKNNITFDAGGLPEGRLEIIAKLLDENGTAKAETVHSFRKLPYRKGEVCLGRDMNWYIDGKKFFLRGAWCAEKDYIKELNAITLNHHATANPSSIKDTYTKSILAQDDMKILASLMHLPAEYVPEKYSKLPPNVILYISSLINKMSTTPQLFAYYLSDEPEVFGGIESGLREGYDLISELDPYHPVIISNDTVSGLKDFANCADINGLHPYPPVLQGKTMNSFDKIRNLDPV